MTGKSIGMTDSKLKVPEQRQNVTVVVRCRPRNAMENNLNSPNVIEVVPDRREILFSSDNVTSIHYNHKRTFTFDRVFCPRSKQIEVYKSVVCPILDEVLLGYSCTIFAYGQTGTGKTYTMEGCRNSERVEYCWEEDPQSGIIPRSIHQLFEMLDRNKNISEFSVRVSFLEIYNEELFDLLGSPFEPPKLKIYNDTGRKGSVFVHQLEEIHVKNKNEVYEILERGANRRQTAATILNANSSRSHTIFSITVHMKENTIDDADVFRTGKLYLVDLAGSENIGRSGAINRRAREAGTINQSLLTLGRVITALSEKNKHIPYRESKLTRLLQDSLGGRTKTVLIATISPAAYNHEETLSTLEYASRAKNIQNRPQVNQHMKKDLIKEYTELIEKYRRDLTAAREKNGVYMPVESFNDMKNNLIAQKDQIIELEDKITALRSQYDKVNGLFEENQEMVQIQQNELNNARNWLNCIVNELSIARDRIRLKTKQIHESEFINTELVKQQIKLYDDATELTSIANEDIENLKILNRKIITIRHQNKHNKKCVTNYGKILEKDVETCIQEFTQLVDDITKLSVNYDSSNKTCLSILNERFDHLLITLENDANCVDNQYSQVYGLINTVKTHLSNMMNQIVSTQDKFMSSFESRIKFLSEKISSCIDFAFESLNQSYLQSQNLKIELGKDLNNHSGKLTNIISDIQLNLQNANSHSQGKEHADGLEALKKKFEDYTKQVDDYNSAFIDKVKHLLSLGASEVKAKNEEFKKDFGSSLNLISQVDAGRIKDIVSELNSCSSHIQDICMQNKSLKTMIDERLTDFSQSRFGSVESDKSQISSLHTEILSNIDHIMENYTDHLKSVLLNHQDMENNIKESLALQQTLLNDTSQNLNHIKQKYIERAKATISHSETFLPQFSENISKLCEKTQFSHETVSQILRGLHKRFIEKIFKRNFEHEPIGDTPQIRNEEIKSLPKPRTLEEIATTARLLDNIQHTNSPTPVKSKIALQAFQQMDENTPFPPFSHEISTEPKRISKEKKSNS